MSARQAETAIPAACCGVDGKVLCAEVDLEWVIEDPAAVRITIRTPNEDTTTGHLIARWILMAGVGSDRFVGDGDAAVNRVGSTRTRIRFLTPEGTIDVVVATRTLVRFLDGCEDACPVGSPDEDYRLAAWISTFLL